jgi:DNA-binding transcriptional LysR family regulator
MQPPFFHRERVAELKATWDTTARDLLICTAQKVGTHLTKRYVVELLAEFRPPPMPISLVLPSTRQMTPRIRVLVEALTDSDDAAEAASRK